MADITSTVPGLTFDQIKSSFGDSFRTIQQKPTATDDDMLNDVMGVKAVFVTATPITLATLLSSYPAGAVNVGKYARVSDLFGSANTAVVCEADTLGGFYWRPIRTDFPQNLTVSQGAVSLIPLMTAPVLSFVGTITGNVNVTPTIANVWPGATFTVTVRSAIPALTTISINGLVGGGTIPLLQGSTKIIRYTAATGWQGD